MSNLSDVGRALLLVGGAIVVLGLLLLLVGGAIVVLGLLLLLAGRIPLLGRLPGDIAIQRGNTSFYFPIVTCIVLSVVLTVILNVALWLLGRH